MLCTDDQILEFLVVLDTIKIWYEKGSTDGNWYEFSYEHTDNVIKIDSSWATYEEGCDDNFIVTLNESSIELQNIEEGHTVYGDIDGNSISNFESLGDVGTHLLEHFGIPT